MENPVPKANIPQRRKRRYTESAAIIGINKRLWHNWLLLGTVTMISTIGLVGMTLLFLWPPSGTPLVLLIGFPLVIFFFVAQLMQQHRALLAERMGVQRAEHNTVEKRYSRVFSLLRVGHILDSETNPRSVFDGITRLCAEVFECDKSSLMLFNDQGQCLEVQSAIGYAKGKVIGAKQRMGEGIPGWTAEHRKPILLNDKADLKKYPGLTLKSRDIPIAMAVPILIRDELIGVLNISKQSKEVKYEECDLEALQALAKTVGMYIVHLEKARKMRRTIDEQQRALHEKYMGTSS